MGDLTFGDGISVHSAVSDGVLGSITIIIDIATKADV